MDSIRVFKKAFPEQNNYQQETLVKTILKTTYGAHDATEDIDTLVMLLKQTKFSGSDLLSFSFPPLAAHQSLLFGKEKSNNITLLHVLIANGVVKHNTAENIAGSGLNYSHLYKMFKQKAFDTVNHDIYCVKNSKQWVLSQRNGFCLI